MEHAYTFAVECTDGTVIMEYEGDNHVNTWQMAKDATQGKHVQSVILLPQRENLQHIVMKPEWDMWSPVFFRRNYRTVGAENPPPITCVGYQKRYAGMSVYNLIFAFEDGSMLLTNNYNAV